MWPFSRRSEEGATKGKHESFKRILSYLAPYKWKIIAGVACMALLVPCQLAPPLVVGRLVDELATGDYGRTHLFVLAFLGIIILEAIFSGVRNRVMHVAGQYFVLEIRKDAYAQVQRLSVAHFEDTTTGDVMSRLSGDVDQIENMMVHGTDDIVVHSLRLVGVVGILFWLDWRIALAAAIPVPIIVIGMVTFARKIRVVYREVRDQFGELNAKLQENITGIRVIKAFSTEEREYAEFEGKSLDYTLRNVRLVRMWTVFYPCMEFIAGFGFVSVLFVGVRLIASGELSTGELVATFGYVMQFYGPIHAFSRINETIQRALAASDRVFELMNAQPDVPERPDALEPKAFSGRVTFEDVHFHYNSGGEVLSGLSIEAQPGQCIALVGRSGAGKTSIINLIPRFYDPTQGRILVDGTDIRDLKTAWLRRNIAMVLQETFLFNSSVRDNIAYARPTASDDEVLAAALAANAHEFIDKLADGYDTLIGERGVRLSGGQKQRLAIARALLADPKILILDEATSSVDTESEVLIHEALHKLIEGRTTFIIAHRLSTVQRADKIVVLEEGIVVEEGAHVELLAGSGHYARMCEMQFALGELGADAPVRETRAAG